MKKTFCNGIHVGTCSNRAASTKQSAFVRDTHHAHPLIILEGIPVPGFDVCRHNVAGGMPVFSYIPHTQYPVLEHVHGKGLG